MLSLLKLFNIVSYMKPTKLIPLGLSIVSGTGLGLSVYNTIKNNERAKQAEEDAALAKERQLELQKQQAETQRRFEESQRQLEESQNRNHDLYLKNLEEVKKGQRDILEDVHDNAAKCSSRANKFIENFSLSSFYDRFFENVKELYSYVFSLSLEYQLAFFNLFTSVLFLGLLSSTALNLYSQFLIDKFRLQERYPKLYRVLEFRKKVQRVYLYYNALVAIYFIFMQIFINLMVLI